MAAGEQKQPPARERSRLFSAGAAYALFGFATAAVSFVFLVDPALRPDPRENQIASISTAAVDRGITLRGYAERVGEQNSAQLRNSLRRTTFERWSTLSSRPTGDGCPSDAKSSRHSRSPGPIK